MSSRISAGLPLPCRYVEDALLRQPRQQLLLAAVGAHAGEADLALLLGKLLRLDHVVANLGRAGLAMQIPDVDVIRIEFAQAGLEILQQPFLVLSARLGGEYDLLPPGSQGSAHHAFVVA